jgi:hypothetical protein
MARSTTNSNNVKISPADIELARAKGTEVLEYFDRVGLGEVRNRAFNLAFSGTVALGGMIIFGWSAATMLAFMVADAIIKLLGDYLRFFLAYRWLKESHQLDHLAGRLIHIADGLEDGSGRRPNSGSAPSPGLILLFGTVSLFFLVPIVGAVVEEIGIDIVKEVMSEESFRWIVGAELAWYLFSSVYYSLAARKEEPGKRLIFMESGAVAVLFVGLLVLIWLPIKFGQSGLYAMFVVIYLIRVSFGIFAFVWTPRAVKTLARRVKENNFSIRRKGNDKSGFPT